MNRRGFIALSGAAAASLVAGGVMLRRATVPSPSLDALIDDLDAMRGGTLIGKGVWSPAMIFTHLTQSVDYSMTGYPQLKPALFRQTLGPVVFFAFSTAGAMRHDLAEPIPGAPALDERGSTDAALDSLIDALARFESYQAALEPHFAYGELSRDEYRAAHVFHVRNHCNEIAAV